MRINNRAARAARTSVKFFYEVFQMTTWNFQIQQRSQSTIGSLRNRRLETRDGRMTTKYGARLCIANLTWHFFVILSSWVFQPSCWVSSLLLEREIGKHRPIKLIAKRFRALWYFFNEYGKTFNCVNNKMLEYDWLLTALIYGSFRSNVSELNYPIMITCNRAGQIGQFSSK